MSVIKHFEGAFCGTNWCSEIFWGLVVESIYMADANRCSLLTVATWTFVSYMLDFREYGELLRRDTYALDQSLHCQMLQACISNTGSETTINLASKG